MLLRASARINGLVFLALAFQADVPQSRASDELRGTNIIWATEGNQLRERVPAKKGGIAAIQRRICDQRYAYQENPDLRPDSFPMPRILRVHLGTQSFDLSHSMASERCVQ